MPKRENPKIGPKYEKSESSRTEGRRSERRTSTKGGSSYGEKRSFSNGRLSGERSSYGERSSRSRSVKSDRISGFERNDRSDRRDNFEENPNLLIGRNPVSEAIKAGRPIDKILFQKDIQGSGKALISQAKELGLQIQFVDKIVLDKLAPGRPHQGVAAYAAAHSYVGIEEILDAAKKKGEDPLVVVLDGLEDPHNLGAILRSCDGAGAHGVIIPSRRSVSLTETVAKASAGAIEYVPVAKTGNLSQTIELLKKKGLWIAAVDMDGENYTEAPLKGPLAIIIGGEGSGVSRILKEKSDYIVSIPMKGHVNSLNASNAAAIVLYEAAHQRSK